MSGLINLLKRFSGNDSGSIATFVGVSLISVIGISGLAVDYSRASQSKSDLFAAADSAALAAARTFGTPAERSKVAQDVFNSNILNIKHVASSSMTPENILKDGANYGFRVSASGQVKTIFGAIVGVDQFNVDVIAEAIGTVSTNTDVALALDTTGSMAGWKIEALKKASVDLVDNLGKISTKPNQLKFSVVPFAEYVNVGMANRNKAWLNVPADYQDPSTKVCWKEAPLLGQTNCRSVTVPATPAGTCYNDGVPYSCGGNASYTTTVCDNTYGAEVEKCAMQAGQWHRWWGCVGSRNNPLDTQDGNYATRIPGLMDTGCSAPLVELTADLTAVKNAINGLTPGGETYIPAGLLWGWRTLSSQAPFEGRTSTEAEPVRKYLILMTDGRNTRSPSYPWHWGGDTALSNTLTKQICANVAADTASNITVFTVAFDVTDTTIKNILMDCAVKTKGQFFDARDSAQFLAAFSKIGSAIADLRLSR